MNNNSDMKQFKYGDALTIEQKLIVEITDDLLNTVRASMKLNCNFKDIEADRFFVILRDASLSYIGHILAFLAATLSDKDQIEPFLHECRDMFDSYLKQAQDLNK